MVLLSRCGRMPRNEGWLRRSLGVPTGAGCDLYRADPAKPGQPTRVAQSSPVWSEGVAAERGEWLAISRSRAGHDPEVRVWRRGKPVRVLRGPRGTSFTTVQRQFGFGAAGVADLAISSTGQLAVVWQTPRTAKHCGAGAARGSFDRDLVTVDLVIGAQRWVNHAPCTDPAPTFAGPRAVEAELVGWTAAGRLVVEDLLKVCPVLVPADLSALVTERAYDVTTPAGGFSGGQDGLWRDIRRVSTRGLEATSLFNPRVPETPRFQGWFSAFVAIPTAGAVGVDCRDALERGKPRRPSGPFLR